MNSKDKNFEQAFRYAYQTFFQIIRVLYFNYALKFELLT